MARGNQRDKAREKNLKAAAGQVCIPHSLPPAETTAYDRPLALWLRESTFTDKYCRKPRTRYATLHCTDQAVVIPVANTQASNPARNLPGPRRTRRRLCVRSRRLVCVPPFTSVPVTLLVLLLCSADVMLTDYREAEAKKAGDAAKK